VARDRRVIDLIIDRAARLFGRVFSLLSPACLQPRDTDHRRYLTLKFGTRACCTVHTPEVNLRAARDRRPPELRCRPIKVTPGRARSFFLNFWLFKKKISVRYR